MRTSAHPDRGHDLGPDSGHRTGCVQMIGTRVGFNKEQLKICARNQRAWSATSKTECPESGHVYTVAHRC
jgi:hypothetical protein